MIPELRRAYNAGYSEERYRSYARRLAERGGMEIPFRLAETPVFLPPALRDEMVGASFEIFRQLSTCEALERSKAAVPERFDVPGCDPLPVFASTDFAVTHDASGKLAPKLIELQAFPTLYAFQVAQCEELARLCPESLSSRPRIGVQGGEAARKALPRPEKDCRSRHDPQRNPADGCHDHLGA